VGQIVLRYYDFLKDSYPLLAGFDQSINRLETIHTTVPLYPFHAIAEVVQAEDISLAILTTVRELAQKATERLVRGAVRGIINLTGTLLHSNRQDVWIKSIDLREELRILTACLAKGRSGRLE
jgi:redox-sensing transcriptional repressor